MKFNQFAIPALALALGSSALLIAHAGPVQGPIPQDQDRQHADHDRGGWDAPPQEFRDVQRQGFHDGVEAARSDFESRHHPNMEHRREYRRPPVPPHDRDAYREGFHRGYDSAFSHFREGHDHDHDRDRDHDRN